MSIIDYPLNCLRFSPFHNSQWKGGEEEEEKEGRRQGWKEGRSERRRGETEEGGRMRTVFSYGAA